MRVNKIIEITVIMCTFIDVLVQYMDCTLPYIIIQVLNGVLQYHCNTVL